MSEASILVERRGPVLCMGFNRPSKYNAFDPAMYHALARAYGELDTDPELRVGLVWAAGDNFTAGLDMPQWLSGFARGTWPALADNERDPFSLMQDKRINKPLVFAIQGICYTIGIELALAADVRVAAPGTRFAQMEVQRGIYAVGGATVRFVEEFGWGNAMRWLLTGDEFDPQEALRLGLIQEIVTTEPVFERGLHLAQRIAAQAPLAVQATLASARAARERGGEAEYPRLLERLVPLMRTEDAQEGVRSFMERRAGVYKGR